MNGRKLRILALFREIEGGFSAYFHRCFREEGFTMPQAIVLDQLARRGPLRMSELAESLSCSGSTASGIVGRLERDGLVCRIHDDRDRRVVMVVLSAGGEDRSLHAFDRYVEQLFAGADAGVLDQVTRGLETLRELLAHQACSEGEGEP